MAVRAQPLQPPLRCRLRQAWRGRDLLSTEASGCHALHGETLLCGSHHVVSGLENTCDLKEMWLVVYGYVIKSVIVRQCAIWENVLICDKISQQRSMFDQKGLEICCFSP